MQEGGKEQKEKGRMVTRTSKKCGAWERIREDEIEERNAEGKKERQEKRKERLKGE